MGRTPCCSKGVKKGPWTADEDAVLVSYISEHGPGNWRSLPKLAGLVRCGKSCRLRWTNYLRPDIKRGSFTSEEEKHVIQLHAILGNKWAAIASQLSGRTDNEVKNLWNTHLKRRLRRMGIDPQTHEPLPTSGAGNLLPGNISMRHTTQWESARLQAEARLSRESLLHSLTTPVKNVHSSSSDLFLRIWNSEVGESFRKMKSEAETSCPSPISQASSTRCGSVSESEIRTQTEDVQRQIDVERGYRDDTFVAESDSSSSIGLDDSSEVALQWLLDFPISNYMNFLGGSIDDYSSYHKD